MLSISPHLVNSQCVATVLKDISVQSLHARIVLEEINRHVGVVVKRERRAHFTTVGLLFRNAI